MKNKFLYPFICILFLLTGCAGEDSKAEGLTVEIQSIVEEEDWLMAVHYPQTNRENINKEVNTYIETQIEKFKQNSGSREDELNVGFEVYTDEPELFVIEFETSARIKGEFESEEDTDIFIYDMESGERRTDLNEESPVITTLLESTVAASVLPQVEESFVLEYEDYEDEDYSNKKLIALTFDDGPHKGNTTRILDVLEKQEVKATFYVLGNRAKFHPEILRRMAESGHQIGSHTYSHKELCKISEKSRLKEIQKTDEIIENIIGKQPTTMRPPYGAYDESVAADAGLPIILWSLDSEDWKLQNADKISNKVIKEAKDGDIVLLHDIHSYTAESVERIVLKLKKEGYTFVTVDQLIRSRGTLGGEMVYTQLL